MMDTTLEVKSKKNSKNLKQSKKSFWNGPQELT